MLVPLIGNGSIDGPLEHQGHRGSLQAELTIFRHLKHFFSEAYHLKVNTFSTSSNGPLYFDAKKV